MQELRLFPTVSVTTAAEALGISRAAAYAMAREGRLPVIHLGPRRMRVRSAALRAMIEGTAPTSANTGAP